MSTNGAPEGAQGVGIMIIGKSPGPPRAHAFGSG